MIIKVIGPNSCSACNGGLFGYFGVRYSISTILMIQLGIFGRPINVKAVSQASFEKPKVTGYSVCLGEEILFIEKEVRNLLTESEKHIYDQVQSVYED